MQRVVVALALLLSVVAVPLAARARDGTLAADDRFGAGAVEGLYRSHLSDDFERADTAPGVGSLGSAPTGQAWAITGPGAADSRIAQGRWVTTTATAVYAYIDLGATVRTLRATVSWSAGANAGAMALIVSANGALITDMVHLVFAVNGWVLHLRQASGSFDIVGSGTYAAVADGRPYDVALSVSGDQVTVKTPGGTTVVTDSRVPALVGSWIVIEHTDATSRFDAVEALAGGPRMRSFFG